MAKPRAAWDAEAHHLARSMIGRLYRECIAGSLFEAAATYGNIILLLDRAADHAAAGPEFGAQRPRPDAPTSGTTGMP